MLSRRSFARLLAALPFAGLAGRVLGKPVDRKPAPAEFTDTRYRVPALSDYEGFVNPGEWIYACSPLSGLRIMRVEYVRCEKQADGSFRYHAVMTMPRHPDAR